MRHLTITTIGRSLSLANDLLQVKEKGVLIAEYPLNRLRSIQIAGRGIILSSNLLTELAARGIPLYIIDFKGKPMVQLSGSHQHAVASLRRKQILFLQQPEATAAVAQAILRGKIKNQRAVLLYFAKGLQNGHPDQATKLESAAEELLKLAGKLTNTNFVNANNTDWRMVLLGYEGRAAAIYWSILQESKLLPESFPGRIARGAQDVTNQCLNLGYAILSSHVWHAITLSGLEPYCGILHTERPGKPSLVLDMMEEYRPWVVDRNVIKLRFQLAHAQKLDESLRKQIISSVHQCFVTKMFYKGKRIRLSAILQRQIYRLCGVFHAGKNYKPYIFKW